jgi:hypothetical protein
MPNIRTAAHVHSDWSYDGSWSLPEIARAFARRRYRVVLMAEHDRGFDDERWAAYRRACAEASNSEVLFVPGIEYSDPENRVHLAVWGENLPFLGEGREPGELVRESESLGALAVLTHPGRKAAWEVCQQPWSSGLLGIELWNRKYDGWVPSRIGTRLLKGNAGWVPFAALDFHRARQFFPLAMILDVEGPIDVGSVVAALRARRCYPEALRMPALRLTRGPALLVARGADGGRRLLVRGLRRAARVRAAEIPKG